MKASRARKLTTASSIGLRILGDRRTRGHTPNHYLHRPRSRSPGEERYESIILMNACHRLKIHSLTIVSHCNQLTSQLHIWSSYSRSKMRYPKIRCMTCISVSLCRPKLFFFRSKIYLFLVIICHNSVVFPLSCTTSTSLFGSKWVSPHPFCGQNLCNVNLFQPYTEQEFPSVDL